MIKALNSPARDLPEGVVLAVGVVIAEAVADDLVREGYAVEYVEPSQEAPVSDPPKPARGPRGRKRGEA